MNADEMAEFVSGIIERSGGIEKWRLLSTQIKDIKRSADKRCQDSLYGAYLLHVIESGDAGCKQLIAIVLLGLTLGDVVYEGNKARKKKRAENN